MAQLLRPGPLLLFRLASWGFLVLMIGVPLLIVWHRSLRPGAAAPIEQPIRFSHKHHAGDDGIDCRYCHALAENSRFAGMPDTLTCMSCHSQLFTDAPLLAPVREAARTGQRLHWQHVYELPDFVFFDHSIHVRSGVQCNECHGDVDHMPVLQRSSSLEMQWCLGCHRNEQRRVRAQQVLTAQVAGAKDLLPDERRLTDCSTCHR